MGRSPSTRRLVCEVVVVALLVAAVVHVCRHEHGRLQSRVELARAELRAREANQHHHDHRQPRRARQATPPRAPKAVTGRDEDGGHADDAVGAGLVRVGSAKQDPTTVNCAASSTISLVDGSYLCALGFLVGMVFTTTQLPPVLPANVGNVALFVAIRASKSVSLSTHIGLMTQLDMFFVSESLGGTMPTEIALLTSLQHMWLVASSIRPRLPLLAQLTNLETLVTYYNGQAFLLEDLPSQFGLLTNLRVLEGWEQPTTGAFPSELGKLSLLTRLDIHSSSIRQPIPSQLALTRLVEFLAGGNSIRDPMPSELGLLTSLVDLELQGNLFEDPLMSELGQLQSLETLSVGDNLMQGVLPTELGLMTSLTALNLSTNEFTGPLPSQLGLLTALRVLLLQDNGFSGTVPEQLAQLSLLTAFDLSRNALAGHVSGGMASLLTNCSDSGLINFECTGVHSQWLEKPVFVATVCVVGVIVVWLAVVFVVVVQRRHRRVIRAANPHFVLFTLLGCAMACASVVPLGIALMDESEGSRTTACGVAPVLASTAAVTILSAVGIRSYPLWRIFDNPELRSFKFSPHVFAQWVTVCIVINLAITVPLIFDTKSTQFTYGCDFSNDVLLTVEVGFVGLLVVFVAFLCFKIRAVPSTYNLTKHIVFATYFLITFSALTIALALVANNPTVVFMSLSLSVVVGAVVFVVVVLGNKIALLFGDDPDRSHANQVAYWG